MMTLPNLEAVTALNQTNMYKVLGPDTVLAN